MDSVNHNALLYRYSNKSELFSIIVFDFVDILKELVLFLSCLVSIYSMFNICHTFDNVTFNTFWWRS